MNNILGHGGSGLYFSLPYAYVIFNTIQMQRGYAYHHTM